MPTDFLGNDYGPGDIVLYAAMSGRAVNMIKAKVVRETDKGTLVVQPLAASRWQQHCDRTRYVDTRTGEFVDRWKHVKTESHYVYVPTGEKLPTRGYISYRDEDLRDYKYVPTVFEDYIEEVSEPPKPVTLRVLENVVLLEKHSE